MFGSEYNWLIRCTRTTSGAPKISLAQGGMFTLAVAVFCFFCIALHAESPESPTVTINVKDCGAVGDGQVHLVREWIKQGRYENIRALRRAIPVIQSADWTVDEAAFEYAKTKLPTTGGTIYFPEGRYVASHASWTIRQNHLRILGDGAARSILLTTPNVNDALVLSPYRHVGWLERADEEFPFQPESGARGSDGVMLRDRSWRNEFRAGDLIFIRNGACRFDQDYGEFNEVSGADENGYLHVRYPLARDYTLDQINWAGTVAADFVLPKPQREITIAISKEAGNFQPAVGETVSIGENLFQVTGRNAASIRVRNPGRGNVATGINVPAGTRIAKSRAVIKVTQSTRDFKAEKLQIVGRRKILNLSNAYGIEFTDCRFVRDPGSNTDTKGGLTIDGDGGRWAKFTRCTLEANPPWPTQFARSFGGVIFDSCTFENASVVFTEFSFDCEVRNSSFTFHGPGPAAIITVGKSGGDYRIHDNRISAENAAVVFDSHQDIQSHQHRGEGNFVIRGNVAAIRGKTQLYRLDPTLPAEIADNILTTP